jgi:Icc-related predicted phosphoesterase
MRIFAISDLHGMLPPPESIPPCDLLCIAGDICPVHNHSLEYQEKWLSTVYTDWVGELKAGRVAWTAGNHDFVLQKASKRLLGALPGHYLRDTGLTLQDPAADNGRITIYGTPWTPKFFDWAFMLPDAELAEIYEQIPYGLDILISHGPPKGVCDRNMGGYECGSESLKQAIYAQRPKVVLCGHIHEARGSRTMSAPPGKAVTTTVYNVSQMNYNYQPVHRAVEIHL